MQRAGGRPFPPLTPGRGVRTPPLGRHCHEQAHPYQERHTERTRSVSLLGLTLPRSGALNAPEPTALPSPLHQSRLPAHLPIRRRDGAGGESARGSESLRFVQRPSYTGQTVLPATPTVPRRTRPRRPCLSFPPSPRVMGSGGRPPAGCGAEPRGVSCFSVPRSVSWSSPARGVSCFSSPKNI